MNENQNEIPAPSLAKLVMAEVKSQCAKGPGWGVEQQMAVLDVIIKELTGCPMDDEAQPKGLRELIRQQLNASAFRQYLVSKKLQPDTAKTRPAKADPLAGLLE